MFYLPWSSCLWKGEGWQELTMAFCWAKVRPYVHWIWPYFSHMDSIQMNRVVGAAWILSPAPLWPVLVWSLWLLLTMAMATVAGQNIANKGSWSIKTSYRLLIFHDNSLVSLLELYLTMEVNSYLWPWPTLWGSRLSLPGNFKLYLMLQ